MRQSSKRVPDSAERRIWKTLGLLLKERFTGLTGKASNSVESIASGMRKARLTQCNKCRCYRLSSLSQSVPSVVLALGRVK